VSFYMSMMPLVLPILIRLSILGLNFSEFKLEIIV
jgi:hypothetical protein